MAESCHVPDGYALRVDLYNKLKSIIVGMPEADIEKLIHYLLSLEEERNQ